MDAEKKNGKRNGRAGLKYSTGKKYVKLYARTPIISEKIVRLTINLRTIIFIYI